MASFNLIDQPWIPVTIGGEASEVSGRQAFERASGIAEVADPSPLVVVAVYRLLLALAHSIVRPLDDTVWKAIWRRREWDLDAVNRYLDAWAHRFDLFDDQRPFYQTARLGFEYERSMINLTHELGPANNELFSHCREEDSIAFSPAQAARYLVAFQSFAQGGFYTHEKDRKPDKYVKGAPLARGAVCIIKGNNLFETLMLNMVDYNPVQGQPFPLRGEDRPAWESNQEAAVQEREPAGYLDWLTWQSRRIRLHPEEEGARTVVHKVVIMKGAQLPGDGGTRAFETMLAYRKALKAAPGQDPFPVVGFRRDRALWRDSLILFETFRGAGDESVGQRPKTLDGLAYRFPDDDQIRPADLSGVAGDQYNVLFWRQEHLPLPLLYLTDGELQTQLRIALDVAEGAGQALEYAAWRLAEFLLAPKSDSPDGKKADRGAVRTLVDSLAPTRPYWSRLSPHFTRFLVGQADDRTAAPYGDRALQEWGLVVFAAARRSLCGVAGAIGTDGRSLHAEIVGQMALERRLGELKRTRMPGVHKEEAHVQAD